MSSSGEARAVESHHLFGSRAAPATFIDADASVSARSRHCCDCCAGRHYARHRLSRLVCRVDYRYRCHRDNACEPGRHYCDRRPAIAALAMSREYCDRRPAFAALSVSAAPAAVADAMCSAPATTAAAMRARPATVTTAATAVFACTAASEPTFVTRSHHVAMPRLMCAYHVDTNGYLCVFARTCALCQRWSPDNAVLSQSPASAGRLAMTCFRRTRCWPDCAVHAPLHFVQRHNFRVISTPMLTLFQKRSEPLNLPRMAIFTTSSHGHGFDVKITYLRYPRVISHHAVSSRPAMKAGSDLRHVDS